MPGKFKWREEGESEGKAWPKKRRRRGRGLEGADADVVSSICADRAITMKKKGLDSRGESGMNGGREERHEGCDE